MWEVLAAAESWSRAREKLAELRSDAVWAALFPAESLSETLQARLIGGGTVLPACKVLQITWQVEVERLLELLRQDAAWLKGGATPAQRAALQGRDPRKPAATTWADSPEHRAEVNAELSAAVEAFRREWGRDPNEQQLVAFIHERNRSRRAA